MTVQEDIKQQPSKPDLKASFEQAGRWQIGSMPSRPIILGSAHGWPSGWDDLSQTGSKGTYGAGRPCSRYTTWQKHSPSPLFCCALLGLIEAMQALFAEQLPMPLEKPRDAAGSRDIRTTDSALPALLGHYQSLQHFGMRPGCTFGARSTLTTDGCPLPAEHSKQRQAAGRISSEGAC